MKRRKTFAKRMDARTIGEAFKAPGMDPRQWVSYGRVRAGQGEDVVEFDRELGAPLVGVVLEPSRVQVRCRVGSMTAGAGEGEWPTFIEGEEVAVLLPEGNERAGAIIIAKLNNAYDPFPFESVAGQDPTTNSFAFVRRRTPFVQEHAGPMMFRDARSTAFFGTDERGGFTIRDSERSVFQMSADVIGWQGPSDENTPTRCSFQFDLTGERIVMAFGSAMLSMESERGSGEAWLIAPSTVTVRTGANAPAEHVMTLEATLALLNVLTTSMAAAGGAAAMVAIEAAVAAGGAPLSPTSVAALTTGLPVAANAPKPPAPTGVQSFPGLGAVGFRTG